MAGPTISADRLCNLTGLTDRRHRQIQAQGYFPPKYQQEWEFAATIQGLFRYYREQISKQSELLIKEKERRAVALRRKEEAIADRIEGRAILLTEAEAVVTRVGIELKNKLMPLAQTLPIKTQADDIPTQQQKHRAEYIHLLKSVAEFVEPSGQKRPPRKLPAARS